MSQHTDEQRDVDQMGDCSTKQEQNEELYLLYTAEVFDVIADCGLVGHSYADDTQTYISVPAIDAPVAMQRLAVCIERIEQWMAWTGSS